MSVSVEKQGIRHGMKSAYLTGYRQHHGIRPSSAEQSVTGRSHSSLVSNKSPSDAPLQIMLIVQLLIRDQSGCRMLRTLGLPLQ